jgi:hypothetical protein
MRTFHVNVCVRSGRPSIGCKINIRRKLPTSSVRNDEAPFRRSLAAQASRLDGRSEAAAMFGRWKRECGPSPSFVDYFGPSWLRFRGRNRNCKGVVYRTFTTFGNNSSCASSNNTNAARHASTPKTIYLKGEDEDGKQWHKRILCYQLSPGASAYATVLLHTTDNFRVKGVSTEICILPSDFWKTFGMEGLHQYLTYHQSAKMSELNRIFNMSYEVQRLARGNQSIIQQVAPM